MTKRLLAAAFAVGASAIASPLLANAGGIGGCSAGFEYVSVEAVLSEGPRPAAIHADEFGNGDGFVCRRLVGPGFIHRIPNPLYDKFYIWHDNDEPQDEK